jgi:hypothetical protein
MKHVTEKLKGINKRQGKISFCNNEKSVKWAVLDIFLMAFLQLEITLAREQSVSLRIQHLKLFRKQRI